MSRQSEYLAKAAAAEAMAAAVSDQITRDAMARVAESWRLLAQSEDGLADDVERITLLRPRQPSRLDGE